MKHCTLCDKLDNLIETTIGDNPHDLCADCFEKETPKNIMDMIRCFEAYGVSATYCYGWINTSICEILPNNSEIMAIYKHKGKRIEKTWPGTISSIEQICFIAD